MIFDITDDYEVAEIKKISSILDFLKSKCLAGDHMQDIEVKNLFYLYNYCGNNL